MVCTFFPRFRDEKIFIVKKVWIVKQRYKNGRIHRGNFRDLSANKLEEVKTMEQNQGEKLHERNLKFEIGKPDSYFYIRFERSRSRWIRAGYTPVHDETACDQEESNE